jgi:predicted ABC-type ATPase
MFYIGVNDPSIAHCRVEHRMSIGGHGIDFETVQRRFVASLLNLKRAIGICDEVYLIDNSTRFELVKIYQNSCCISDLSSPALTWLPQ